MADERDPYAHLCMMRSDSQYSFMKGKFYCSHPKGHEVVSVPHVAYEGHDPAERVIWYGPWQDGTPDPRSTTPAPEEAPDTLPEWLFLRMARSFKTWDELSEDDRDYWAHEARAVRRAVARSGFKKEDPDGS